MKNPFYKKPRNDYDSYDDAYDSGFYRGEDEDDGVVGDFERETASLPPKKTANSGAANKLKVVKPRGYQDGPMVVDHLMDGLTVVMNIEELERPAALRLIDFLLGALQVLGGELKRVTKTTLVVSPRAGELADEEERDEDDPI